MTMATARLCVPIFDDLYQVSGGGQYHDVHATGAMRHILFVSLESMRGLNISIIRHATTGKLMNHAKLLYDNCIGSLQQNESDYIFGPVTLPVPGSNITPAVVDGFEQMNILTSYAYANSSRKTHVLEPFLSFTPVVWSFVFMSFATIISLHLSASMLLKGWSSKRLKRSWNRIVKQCTSSSQLPARTQANRPICQAVLNVCILLSVLASTYYPRFMIKTDMVVMKPPITIESYDQLLSSGRRPVWLEILPDVLDFQSAHEGTKEKAIWDKAVSMGLNDSLIKSNIDSFMTASFNSANHLNALLIQRFYGLMTMNAECAIFRANNINDNGAALFRTDASAKEKLRIQLRNANTPVVVVSHVDERIMRSFEADLMNAAARLFDTTILIDAKDKEQKSSKITECACNVVRMPEPLLHPVNAGHLRTLFAVCASAVALAVSVHVWQVVACRSNRRALLS